MTNWVNAEDAEGYQECRGLEMRAGGSGSAYERSSLCPGTGV